MILVGAITENKEKYISFNVKINVKLEELTNKDGKEVQKNIQPRFRNSCRLFNLDDDQCKNFMELYSEDEGYKPMRHKCVYPY